MSKNGQKTSAGERHLQFPNDTFVSSNRKLLFCKSCNLVLDHSRKSSIDQHMGTEKHKKRKAAYEALSTPKRQCVIDLTQSQASASTVASKERTEVCQEWVAMCAAANIPLSKTDHPAVQPFLQQRVVNGGSIPHSKQLRECYLAREYGERVAEVKDVLKDKSVAIITDEMSDDNGRYALNILAAPLELIGKEEVVKSMLIETVFLENTNHSSVSQAVVAAVIAFGISFNNILIINTDNAAYMRKAFSIVLSGLFPNAVHVTCLAHVMNLLGDAFKKPFKLVHTFVKNMNAMFYKAGSRKSRFLTHIKNCMPGKTATMPPNPISTRWNCWFDCVKYHVSHFDHYKTFLSSEINLSKSLAPDYQAADGHVCRRPQGSTSPSADEVCG